MASKFTTATYTTENKVVDTDNTDEGFEVVMDGVTMFVPMDPNNKDYQQIKEDQANGDITTGYTFT